MSKKKRFFFIETIILGAYRSYAFQNGMGKTEEYCIMLFHWVSTQISNGLKAVVIFAIGQVTFLF